MTPDDNDRDADLRAARAAALNYLARREHSRKELTDKLLRRGIEASAVSSVVEQLAANNLVSDTRYAEAYVRSRVARLYGPMRIRAELRQRGVADGILEEALASFDHQWQQLAEDWAGRKYSGDPDRKAQARVYRSGTNRGFTHDQMMQAINRLKRID
jgi:regulatory protein